tara:strand:- start:2377 stop:2514 length:138 start_codon:yes stop_codon:yes gene_type:complete
MVALLEKLQQFIIRMQKKLNQPIKYKNKHLVLAGIVVIIFFIVLT